MSLPLRSTFAVGVLAVGAALVVMAVPRMPASRPASPAPDTHRSESAPESIDSVASRLPSSSSSASGGAAATENTGVPSAIATKAAIPVGSAPDAAAMHALVVSPLRVGDEPVKPIPTVTEYFEDYLEIDMKPAKIELGRRLFHDVRLSRDNTISCASCHDLRFGGADRAPTAIGVAGHVGPINTPTVFNASLNVQQFWDGRAEDLESQADGPPNAPGEMASNWTEITDKLMKDDSIVSLLREAYDIRGEVVGDVTKDHWLEAISDFERTLITPGAPFDAYLSGDAEAVGTDVKEGYQLFKDVGCIECHSGMGVGGGSFQKLGRKNPYFGAHANGVDLGRFNVTKRDEDKNVFKVPGLRNVAVTGPWFHDASQTTLEDAVRTMARVQLDKVLNEHQVSRIVAFLRSLTGKFDGRSIDAFGSLK